jgi:hypothetical protein
MKPVIQVLLSGLGVFILFVIMILAVIGLASVCFTGGQASYRPPAGNLPPASPTRTVASQGAEQDFVRITVTRTVQPAQTSTPLPPPSSTPVPISTPPPAPTRAPAPTQAPSVAQSAPIPTQAAPPPATANFSGVWRIVDTVTEGSNIGQTYTFDVRLSQTGAIVTGGNSGIAISGRVEGATASLAYGQPALGYSGTFTWTMNSSGVAQGSFTNSYPNAGTSSLVRIE